MAVLHPLVFGGLAVAYLTTACCDPSRDFIKHVDGESRPAHVAVELQGSQSAATPAMASMGGGR